MRTWNHYIATLLLAGIVIPCTATFFVNFLVDPYGYWNVVNAKGFNEFKPALYNRVEIAKLNEVRRASPDAVILGSSRAGFLNAEHPGWGDLKAYNLAIPGAGISRVSHAGMLAGENNDLRQIVFGIDLFMFTEPKRENKTDTEPSPTDTAPQAMQVPEAERWYDPIRFTVSSAPLVASYETVRYNQRVGELPEPEGPKSEDLLSKNALRDSRAAFRQTLRIYEMQSRGFFGEPDTPKFGDCATVEEISLFREFLTFCHVQEIDLRMFFSPVHATQLQVYERVGEWENFEQLKRCLVEVNESVAREHGGQAFELWDFSGFDKYTTEAVPESDADDKLMTYYYESSHYHNRLGDIVFDRIFDLDGADSEFGVVLTSENVEEHLETLRNDRAVYEQTQQHRESLGLFHSRRIDVNSSDSLDDQSGEI